MRRVKLWREHGRPEARLSASSTAPTTTAAVRARTPSSQPRRRRGCSTRTGLATGSTFGETVGGYGIEIDMATPDSPPGTIVLARVVDLFGPGLSGEMTYYETEAGARVFSAGTLDFGGSATFWPISRMLENLWNHMLEDLPTVVPHAASAKVGLRLDADKRALGVAHQGARRRTRQGWSPDEPRGRIRRAAANVFERSASRRARRPRSGRRRRRARSAIPAAGDP